MLRRVTIARVRGLERRWGFGRGPLAVTRWTDCPGSPGWTVTHVPTGYAVVPGPLRFREACRLRAGLLALDIWARPVAAILEQQDAVTKAIAGAGLACTVARTTASAGPAYRCESDADLLANAE